MIRNWKTSILGALAGIFGTTSMGWLTTEGKPNWFAILFGILAAGTGVAAKDHDVTGGGPPSK